MLKAYILGMAAVFAVAGAAHAQQCAAGPKCTAQGNKMAALIEKQKLRLGMDSASEAALGAFCVNWAQAELARFCGDELKKLGRPDCADLAYQQQAENKRVALQSAESAAAFAEVNISKPAQLFKSQCK